MGSLLHFWRNFQASFTNSTLQVWPLVLSCIFLSRERNLWKDEQSSLLTAAELNSSLGFSAASNNKNYAPHSRLHQDTKKTLTTQTPSSPRDLSTQKTPDNKLVKLTTMCVCSNMQRPTHISNLCHDFTKQSLLSLGIVTPIGDAGGWVGDRHQLTNMIKTATTHAPSVPKTSSSWHLTQAERWNTSGGELQSLFLGNLMPKMVNLDGCRHLIPSCKTLKELLAQYIVFHPLHEVNAFSS